MTTLADELVPDELWALVAPLLPAPPRPPYGGRHRTIPDRNCFAAIVFMARTSTLWRLLPARELSCGSPATCWRRPPAADEPDELVVRRYLCIHFPHKLSELLRATLAHPVVVGALTRLIGPNIKAMQSMLFIKSEDKPGQAWHQDELFIPTRTGQ